MGKPGAILLIGAGAFILVLGWSGKLSAVWDLMQGNIPTPDLPSPGDIIDSIPDQPEPPKPQPGDTEKPVSENTYAPGRQMVVFRSDETTKRCILAVDLAAPGSNGNCDARYQEVIRVTDGLKMCAKKIRGAGEASNDYGWVLAPTGAMVRRYQPNVRG